MDIEYIKSKLPQLKAGNDFTSLSSDDSAPYSLHVKSDMSFVFESKSFNQVYYAENEKELIVAARDCIREFESDSRTRLPDFGGNMEHRWSAGPVVMRAVDFGNGTYKVHRDNRMVSSKTELASSNSTHNVFRKVGLHKQTDMDFILVEDALYIFLANFESTRIAKDVLKESIHWAFNTVSQLEGRKLKLPRKLDLQHSGMLARQVMIFYKGEELKGVLLSIRSGTSAEVITEKYGNLVIPKTDIWIR